jgi:hypothetical protein
VTFKDQVDTSMLWANPAIRSGAESSDPSESVGGGRLATL